MKVVLVSDNFKREAKRLIKKYRSLGAEILTLIEDLKENPRMGDEITENCYKIRLAIASKGKGKSGGARVITFVFALTEDVILLSIYDKSDKSNISDKDLNDLLKDL
jgi:hypothetical protein